MKIKSVIWHPQLDFVEALARHHEQAKEITDKIGSASEILRKLWINKHRKLLTGNA
jgi:hypothetical protein